MNADVIDFENISLDDLIQLRSKVDHQIFKKTGVSIKNVEDKKKTLSFQLSEKEQENRDNVLKAYKQLYPDDEYGIITYSFTPTGIGNGVDMYIKNIDKHFDITDYDW